MPPSGDTPTVLPLSATTQAKPGTSLVSTESGLEKSETARNLVQIFTRSVV